MKRLRWRPMPLRDRDAIMVDVAQDNSTAAIELVLEFEPQAENPRLRGCTGSAVSGKGTREIVVRPDGERVHRVPGDVVEVLRALRAAQQWP